MICGSLSMGMRIRQYKILEITNENYRDSARYEMAKKKRKQRKNSIRRTMSLTKEQFTKLKCDAQTFLKVARLTEEYMIEIL